MTYPVEQGHKQTITERGWFAPPFTACRFAVHAQQAIRAGYDVPLARTPNGADNIVRILQLAGDNTPGNGSTMRQGQKAVREVFGDDAPFLFGTLDDAELFDAVRKGATVGFAVRCGRLPRYLKNFVGYGYTGGHYMAIDAVYDDGTVDLSDPMYRPARQAKPRRVPWSDLQAAIVRDNVGHAIVSLAFEDAAYLLEQQTELTAKIAQAQADLAAFTAQAAQIQARLDAQALA